MARWKRGDDVLEAIFICHPLIVKSRDEVISCPDGMVDIDGPDENG